MLLDTASLYFRAFFGVPDSFRAPNGTPVNAVRGLLDFISRLVSTYQPSHLVCCWDNDWRPQWRVDLVPSYKAHRVASPGQVQVAEMASSADTAGEQAPDDLAVQVPLIILTLEALGIAIVGKNGYEADDVIGTLAATAPMPVDVVTGDRDLFQVVDDDRQVRVLYIARGVGKHEIVDDAWVRAKYGVPAAAYVDYATLRGDASDGLPGVSGIGEKTAASLLTSHGDLEGILAEASRPGGRVSGGVAAKLGGGDRLPRGGPHGGRGRPGPRPRRGLGRPGPPHRAGASAGVRPDHRRARSGQQCRPDPDGASRDADGLSRYAMPALPRTAVVGRATRGGGGRPGPRRPTRCAVGGLVRRRSGGRPPALAFDRARDGRRGLHPAGRATDLADPPPDLVGGGWLTVLGYAPGSTTHGVLRLAAALARRNPAGPSSRWACRAGRPPTRPPSSTGAMR